jgi:hypothetical protein
MFPEISPSLDIGITEEEELMFQILKSYFQCYSRSNYN